MRPHCKTHSLNRVTSTYASKNPPSCILMKKSSTALVRSSDSPRWMSITRPKAVARIVSMVKEPYVLNTEIDKILPCNKSMHKN